MRNNIRTTTGLLTILIAISLHSAGQQAAAHQKPNVLFICIDDLRPELGCYGNSLIHSPNIDSFSAHAARFNKQFVVVPTCGPSRACMLTGKFPRQKMEISNDVLELRQKQGIASPNPESFVHHLRNNGYYTVGIGKITHSPDGYIYKYQQPKSDVAELPASWNEMLLNAGPWGTGWNAFFGYAGGSSRTSLAGAVQPYENAGTNDEDYPDGLTAQLAVQKLQQLSSRQQPFFLAVGFFKPHLPFNAPKKYWDLYQEDAIPLPPLPDIPAGVNPASLQSSGEFNGYKKGEEKASLTHAVSDAYARRLRHAYYAAVSYVDAQVGKVLDELKRLHLDNNTIIVLWGDHGWHLGDDRVWGKHTLSEWSLRSPLIIKMPGSSTPATIDQVVSSIDIYPTLMELCGLQMPYAADGKSFVSLLKDQHARWQEAAYSYYNKGISVRTGRYRLTKYFRDEEPLIELYDYQTDPNETKNIAADHPALVKKLLAIWEKGNTGLFNLTGQTDKK